MRLYSDLTSWYRLVDPVSDHVDEARLYAAALAGATQGAAETLLELGTGGGHNAFYLKRRFRCSLTDVSHEMLALSKELNPECEHAAGDMRSIRLNRTFDAVLLHDAVVYMTSEDDLLAAARTAFVHTRPGGAALFAPDYLRETFRESSNLIQGDEGSRALRGIEWAWDPDPNDTTYRVEYAFVLRDKTTVAAVHDPHVEGLFSEAAWHRILKAAGFEVETIDGVGGDSESSRIFLCRRRRSVT